MFGTKISFSCQSNLPFCVDKSSRNLTVACLTGIPRKNKLLKKTKFWRRNRSFTFTPEVKVYPLQSIESTFVGLELATQLISHHASIFLGVIILGMNKPRPWKCPWTSSKKRKKRTKNENTALNEQAKVDGKLKLRLSGIKPAKDRVASFNCWIIHTRRHCKYENRTM